MTSKNLASKDTEDDATNSLENTENPIVFYLGNPFAFLRAVQSYWNRSSNTDIDTTKDCEAYLQLKTIVPIDILEPCRFLLRRCDDTNPVSFVYALPRKDFTNYMRLLEYVIAKKNSIDTDQHTADFLDSLKI